MSGSQKKIIGGKSFLFPDDAIVGVSVSVFSPWHAMKKVPYWYLGADCTLKVCHVNFPQKSQEFRLFCVDLKTEEMVAPRDRIIVGIRGALAPDEVRVMKLPGIVRVVDTFSSTVPALTEFIIDAYMGGEVSDQKTLRFFRMRYEEKLATK